jgi:hypothetical protein
MDLFITCECSRKTSVTPAKCGEDIPCICGKVMRVPPLSVLRSQCQNSIAGDEPQSMQNERNASVRPLRPIPALFSLLIFFYAAFQALRLPIYFKLGPQVFGFGVGVTAIAFVCSVLLYRYSRRPD